MTANQTKKNGIMPCGFAYSNDPHFNRKRFTEQKRPPRSIPSHNVCDYTHIMTKSFNNKVQVSWDPQDLTDFELQKKVQHWASETKTAKWGNILHFGEHLFFLMSIWKRQVFFVFWFLHFLCKASFWRDCGKDDKMQFHKKWKIISLVFFNRFWGYTAYFEGFLIWNLLVYKWSGTLFK